MGREEVFRVNDEGRSGRFGNWGLALAVLVLAVLVLAGCCRTEVIETPVYLHDTITNNVTSVERVVLRDSVVRTEKVKGDTVYLETMKWKTAYVDRWQHDSVEVVREIPVEVKKTVEVEKKLSGLQKAVMAVGIAAIIIGIGLLVLFFI